MFSQYWAYSPPVVQVVPVCGCLPHDCILELPSPKDSLTSREKFSLFTFLKGTRNNTGDGRADRMLNLPATYPKGKEEAEDEEEEEQDDRLLA